VEQGAKDTMKYVVIGASPVLTSNKTVDQSNKARP
jgi:hypothetical protein